MTLARATDIAIGLLLVVLLASLVASGVTEAVATLQRKRAKDLWSAIHRLLDEADPIAGALNDGPATGTAVADARPGLDQHGPLATSVTSALYASPFVNEFRKLDRSGRTLISKMRSTDFARGLLWVGTLDGATTPDGMLQTLESRLPKGAPVAQVLAELTGEVGKTLTEIGDGLATWFDTQMARVTRVYRRWARYIALAVGIVVAVGANVDLVFIARTLNRNDALRAAAVAEAGALVNTCSGKTGDALNQCLTQQTQTAQSTNQAFQLPIGWTDPASREFGGWNLVWKLLGWTLVAVATMQGAPFWFDLLRRVTGIRA